MTTKTAQFTPLGCPICREQHDASRTLCYDGRGINSCGMYRVRIATFQHNDDVTKELGYKFAAAPAMYEALQQLVHVEQLRKQAVAENDYVDLVLADSKLQKLAQAALAQARGRQA